MQIRRGLFAMIQEIAERDGLDQWTLAWCLGMARTRASWLLSGRIEQFNSETLIDILARLGVTVELRVQGRTTYLRHVPLTPRPGFVVPRHWVASIPGDHPRQGAAEA